VRGVCGKDENTAAMQDLLVYATKGLAQYTHRARQLGAENEDFDLFIVEALFTTVTNVNFDADRIRGLIERALELRDAARALYLEACQQNGVRPESLSGAATWKAPADEAALLADAVAISIAERMQSAGPDITGLIELATYGLKGAAAYVDHAYILGKKDPAVLAFFAETLDALCQPQSAESLTGLCLHIGEVNLRVMELLDDANTGAYGHPEPTSARISAVKGKAILVSGHDLKDLHALLEQTKDKGINIYTHGEMLPALAYPELKKYPHLVGNYGGAWQDQKKEFDAFPGAILMTTNCIQEPRQTYKARIFTTGLVGFPGVVHVPEQRFAPVIEAALAAPGFTEDEPEKRITIGFAHNAVMQVADKVIDAVKAGAIKHFYLIGGCDGAKSGRNYYTDFAQKTPDDTVILTLACGKYRFNKLDFGDIGGIPRLLDMGQCNDAYSAVQVAVALAKAFDTDVNSLPLSFILSWYEQKAVVILLSLLHLGIKNIRLGPTLPAFVTPPVLDVLVKTFQIAPTTTVEADMAATLG
jgi:hydroxylamine reductase